MTFKRVKAKGSPVVVEAGPKTPRRSPLFGALKGMITIPDDLDLTLRPIRNGPISSMNSSLLLDTCAAICSWKAHVFPPARPKPSIYASDPGRAGLCFALYRLGDRQAGRARASSCQRHAARLVQGADVVATGETCRPDGRYPDQLVGLARQTAQRPRRQDHDRHGPGTGADDRDARQPDPCLCRAGACPGDRLLDRYVVDQAGLAEPDGGEQAAGAGLRRNLA